jgi:amino acid transporter
LLLISTAVAKHSFLVTSLIMGVDPEIAPTTSASKAPEVSSQYDGDFKKGIVEDNAHFTAAELAKYGQTQRGLSPRHVQLMAIGGTQTHLFIMLLLLYR